MSREMVLTLFPETQAFAGRELEGPSALSVRNLTKVFDQEPVLDNVNFSLGEGESLVLLGPSGSGKSTTLRLIAGLEAPDSGEIVVKGKRVDHLRARDRNVGVIFQNYALFPRMTVAENIAFGLKLRGVKRSRRHDVVERLLSLTGLAEHRKKYPIQISGGQQQRVAIARALAYEPDVLLFDESFSALDPQTRVPLRREIRTLLKTLMVPALFITHDQEEAMELGDQVAILNRGRLEQIGPPVDVYNDPHTEFVATFLGAANVIEGTWQDGLIRLDSGRYLPGIGIGPLEPEGTRAKVIFRLEDVALSSPAVFGDSPYPLGRGAVTEVSFSGATESLTVRLDASPASNKLYLQRSERPSEGAPLVIKALRTKWEAQRLRLASGDMVSVGLKSYKLLKD
jgi:putative spermidine/putrescine transport system ATP-binding protein